MNKKCLVLFSGGIDSTTCLANAIKEYGKENIISITMTYGQKHDKEINCAKQIASYYGVEHLIKDISEVFSFDKKCTLLKGNDDIEYSTYEDQSQKNNRVPVNSYVPFRNGVMLSYATAIALSLECNIIYYGAHSDDSLNGVYPDCSEEFEYHMARAIESGTGNIVSMKAPFVSLKKSEIIKIGFDNKVPYELTWSCYEGREKSCGKCASCLCRLKAFEKNNIKDPVEYEEV